MTLYRVLSGGYHLDIPGGKTYQLKAWQQFQANSYVHVHVFRKHHNINNSEELPAHHREHDPDYILIFEVLCYRRLPLPFSATITITVCAGIATEVLMCLTPFYNTHITQIRLSN